MIGVQTPLQHERCESTVAERIPEVPAHAQQHDLGFKMPPFEQWLLVHTGNSSAWSNQAERSTALAFLATEPEHLHRVFFTRRFAQWLDKLGYLRFRQWQLYGEEGLAKRQAMIWLYGQTLTLEYGNVPLTQFTVSSSPTRSASAPSSYCNASRRSTACDSFAQNQRNMLGDEQQRWKQR